MAEEREPNAVAEANWVAYQRARDSGHDTWLESAQRCDNFYLGEQWDQADKDRLDAEGRPALTINEIMKVVNAYLGKQATQRADILFKPRRDATVDTAKAINLLCEQVLDHNHYEFLEKEVFEDGIIIDRGYFDLRIDFADNIMGDIVVTTEDPYEILPDPDAKSYDPKGWNSVISTKWMSLDDIEAHYSKDKRDEVEAQATAYHTYGEDSVRFDGTRTFGDDDFGFQEEASHLDDKTIRSVRVIERQYQKLTSRRYFVDNQVGDMNAIPDELKDADALKLAKKLGLSIVRKVGKRIRWTTTVDNVVLFDDWSPYRSYTIIPYFPFFRKGRTSGVVRQLLDPQEQFNKMESQMLHIVNTTANSGWTIEEGSLHNMTTEELEERGAETGLVISYKRGMNPPQKIESNKIPTGLDRLSQKAQYNIAGIAGVDGLVKNPEREVSGVALDAIEARGLIQIDVPFDSLKRTRYLVAEKMLELIQDFYTETRVMRVTVGNGYDNQDQELIINGVTAAGELINNVMLGEYDVVVGSRPARDNYEDAQFTNALRMREVGVMIPDDVVIRHSQLDNKHEIANRVAQIQGVAPPTPEEVQISQMQQAMEMQAMKLNVDKIAAEVQELRARAAQAFAKAQSMEGDAQSKQMELGVSMRKQAMELQAKLEMFYADLQNKLQLAGMHTQNKREVTAIQEATKHSIKELDVLTKSLPAPRRTQ